MKKALALLLACLMLTACGAEKNGIEAPEQTTAETTAATTTTVRTTTAPAQTEPAEAEVIPLREASVEQLASVEKSVIIGDHCVFSDYLYKWGAYVGEDNDIYYNDGSPNDIVRSSSRTMRVEGFDDMDIEDEVKAQMYHYYYEFTEGSRPDLTPYKISAHESIMKLNGYSDDHDKIEVKDFILGYQVSDEITVNAFIRKGKDDYRADVIIDPAYMFGLPLYSGKTEDMTFDINGHKVIADTLSINAYSGDTLNEGLYDDKYIYAEVVLDWLDVFYYLNSGYECTSVVKSVTPITEDVEKVLTSAYSIEMNEGKYPEAEAIYKAITQNTETIYTESIIGMTLLDLDFDGTPELLVSNKKADAPAEAAFGRILEDALGYGEVDVDIYRIKDGGLKYIDTLCHNLLTYGAECGNVLGLKTLPDGTKKWFSMSRKNRAMGEDYATDYLFSLEGDSLSFTELLSVRGGYEYYYKGEKIVPTEVPSTDNDEYSRIEWNGYSSIKGDIYGIFINCRQDYCEDMNGSTYTLMSNRLYVPNEYATTYTKIEPTARELSYDLAYLVDAFCFGEYDPSKMSYYYRFYVGGAEKPVLYLYPEETTELSVKVEYRNGGELTCTYPKYNNGWNVTAYPDGTLFDENGNEYYCLYWEGVDATDYDDSKGFCVAASDTAEFLREKLLYIGLSAREANEFIIYWLPILEKNPYNRITFHTEDYAAAVPLTISEKPDSSIRVFMTYSPLETEIDIPAQELPHYERNGFTVVEWGGGER